MKTSQQLVDEGFQFCTARKFDEAIKIADQILDKDNKFMEAYRLKFKCYQGQGKDRPMIELAAKAYEVEPDYKFALYCEAIARRNIGQYQKSLELLDRAIALHPEWDFPYNCKGRVLDMLGRYDEAIVNLQKSFELDPSDPTPLNTIATILNHQGRQEEAIEYFNKGLKTKPNDLLLLCNRGQLYNKLGKQEEALKDFRTAHETLERGEIDERLVPGNLYFIKRTVKVIEELDAESKKAQEAVKKADQSNPLVKKFAEQVKKLQEEKDKATTKLIETMDNKDSNLTQQLLAEVDRLKKDFATVQVDLAKVKTEVKELKNQYEEIKEELDNKMDDFNKKLDKELAKIDLKPEEKDKIKEYFKAFIETFSSIYVTSQVVDSGQVRLDASSAKASFLSMVASFTPFVGNILSKGITTLNEFLQSKEMKTNARKAKALASDPTALSQLVGKAGYEIVLNKEKQKQIFSITNQEMDVITGNILEKITKFCKNLEEQFDRYMYTSLYKTAAARLGHNDANDLIGEWLNDTINPYDVEGDFVKKAISGKQSTSEPAQEMSSPMKKVENRTSCCNLF